MLPFLGGALQIAVPNVDVVATLPQGWVDKRDKQIWRAQVQGSLESASILPFEGSIEL